MKFEHGDSVTVQTSTINGGEAFEATVLDADSKSETLSVEPESLNVIQMAIVGFSEVEQL